MNARITKLRDLLDVQNGFAFKTEFFSDSEGVPLIRIRDLGSNTTETSYKGEFRDEFIVEQGDYLIGMDGNFRCRRWAGPRALLNQRVCRLRNFSPRVLPEYIFYGIQPRLDAIEASTAFATVKHIAGRQILDIDVPLPSLDEQRRIVDLLSRAEGIVRLRCEAQKKAAAIIPALFLDMFGDPATNPPGWPVAAIGDLASYTRYGPRFHDRSYADNGAHILRTTDLGYAGELAWQQSPKLAVSAEESERYSLKPGTLLVTRTGATIGKTALFRGAKEPCIAGAYLIEVGLSERVVPDFVLHFLLGTYGQAQLSRGTRTVAQPNINAPTICAIRLPIPPLHVQQRFERHVRAVDSVLEQQRRAVEAAHATFQALLSRAFGGDLTAAPRPAEEAAVA